MYAIFLEDNCAGASIILVIVYMNYCHIWRKLFLGCVLAAGLMEGVAGLAVEQPPFLATAMEVNSLN